MLKRIANLFKGFFGLFVSNVEKSNPKALIEVEKENLKKQIIRFNESLTNQAALVERLMRQIKGLEQKESELIARINTYIKTGHRTTAGQMALALQTIKSQLDESRETVAVAEGNYQKIIKSRDAAITDTKEKIEQLNRMITETEMLEAQAELQEMATGMMTEIGGPAESLNRVESQLQERRDKAAARLRVASSDVNIEDGEPSEAEQNALAELALEEFEKTHSLKAPPSASALGKGADKALDKGTDETLTKDLTKKSDTNQPALKPTEGG